MRYGLRGVQKLFSRALHRDAAVHHDIAPMRKLERMKRILLDQKDRQLFALIKVANGRENLAYDERGEAKRRLVEQ